MRVEVQYERGLLGFGALRAASVKLDGTILCIRMDNRDSSSYDLNVNIAPNKVSVERNGTMLLLKGISTPKSWGLFSTINVRIRVKEAAEVFETFYSRLVKSAAISALCRTAATIDGGTAVPNPQTQMLGVTPTKDDDKHGIDRDGHSSSEHAHGIQPQSKAASKDKSYARALRGTPTQAKLPAVCERILERQEGRGRKRKDGTTASVRSYAQALREIQAYVLGGFVVAFSMDMPKHCLLTTRT